MLVMAHSVDTNTIHYFDRHISEVLAGILLVFRHALICEWHIWLVLKNHQVRFTNVAEIIFNRASAPR